MTTLEWVQQPDPSLQAVIEYARNGDSGALRYLSSRYEESATPFGAWVRRLARNAEIGDSGHAVDDDPQADEVTEVRAALRRLPPEERQVMVLHYFGGLSPGAIAKVTGRTEAEVEELEERGRKLLRAELTPLG